MKKRTKRKLLERAHLFLRAENGGAEIFVILIILLSISSATLAVDIEIQKVKQTKFQIKEQIVMALKGASKRIDFYEASERNIVIESDFIEQFERYLVEALLLNEDLEPLNTQDFGITGRIEVKDLKLVDGSYDNLSGRYFEDSALVSYIDIPMTMKILGVDFDMKVPFKTYAEIRGDLN